MKAFDKPLTAEEERKMLIRWQAGDIVARNILVEKNMRLVAHMVKKYSNTDKDMDDLLQTGTIGLIKAVNSFKPDKNIRLATYAAKCIDNELLMLFRNDKKRMGDVSIYESIGTDKEGNEISLLDVVSDENVDVVEEYIFDQRITCIMKVFDKVLTTRERNILCSRYGLYGKEECTQQEIAKALGISRSYVSRIEKKALGKLKKSLQDSGLA